MRDRKNYLERRRLMLCVQRKQVSRPTFENKEKLFREETRVEGNLARDKTELVKQRDALQQRLNIERSGTKQWRIDTR